MEYLVSHQLLLASMHTLCLVVQPAASFGNPAHRHHNSWGYWLRFLRALGDRRTGSLLLAVSQVDKVDPAGEARATAAVAAEFDALSTEAGGGVSGALGASPLWLDYRGKEATTTMEHVTERLTEAAEVVSRDWWVPASYERLADLVRRVGHEMAARRALPILSRSQLQQALKGNDDEGLQRMASDAQLLQRGVEYLEAVGDVMSDERLDCLLLDPVAWFAAFLAHFIRDDGNPPAEVQRGVVAESDVVAALRHEYTRPDDQVPEVMALVCKLELACPHTTAGGEPAYLFPCLLPSATPDDLAAYWPAAEANAAAKASGEPLVVRGHRFRASGGFMPPGLFPGLLARLRHLPKGCIVPEQLWSNAAVLAFPNASRVLLRADVAAATVEVVAAAPKADGLFVGAAMGQASVIVWLGHLVRTFLQGYEMVPFEEAWLCPNPECHVGGGACCATSFDLEVGGFRGSEHKCENEGCVPPHLVPLPQTPSPTSTVIPTSTVRPTSSPATPTRTGASISSGWRTAARSSVARRPQRTCAKSAARSPTLCCAPRRGRCRRELARRRLRSSGGWVTLLGLVMPDVDESGGWNVDDGRL